MDIEAFIEHIYKGKKRKTGENSTSHMYATRDILKSVGVKEETILNAALLHDIIEDTTISREYLILKFGSNMVKLLDLLSKDEMWHTSYCRIKGSLDEMEASWVNYPEAILIKMADRLHNLQTIEGFRTEKQERYINETEELLIPLFEKILNKNNLGYYKESISKLLERLHEEVKKIKKRLKMPSKNIHAIQYQ